MESLKNKKTQSHPSSRVVEDRRVKAREKRPKGRARTGIPRREKRAFLLFPPGRSACVSSLHRVRVPFFPFLRASEVTVHPMACGVANRFVTRHDDLVVRSVAAAGFRVTRASPP